MDWRTILIIIHVVGTAIGVGGATVSDILFFSSLKRGVITKIDYLNFKTLSRIIWIGAILLFITGIGILFVYHSKNPDNPFIANDKALAKLIITIIILLNGYFMHWKIFSLIKSQVGQPTALSLLTKKQGMLYFSGALSIVSWWSAMILGSWRHFDFSFWTIIISYLIILIGAVIVANIIGRIVLNSYNNSKE